MYTSFSFKGETLTWVVRLFYSTVHGNFPSFTVREFSSRYFQNIILEPLFSVCVIQEAENKS